MKAKKEMAERHLINESHVYVGEGEIPSPTHHTRMCAHARLCTGSANESQTVCVLAEAWERWRGKWGWSVGNMCCSLRRSNLACREVASQSESLPIALGWSSSGQWMGRKWRQETEPLGFPHLSAGVAPTNSFQGSTQKPLEEAFLCLLQAFCLRVLSLTSSCSCSRLLLEGHLPLLSLQGDCCLLKRSWLWAGVDTQLTHPALDTCRGPSSLSSL